MKILIVEDDPIDLAAVKASVDKYVSEKRRTIEFNYASSLGQAVSVLNNTFDGALVDLKLGSSGTAGQEIVTVIREKFRIPTAIITGTPTNIEADSPLIGFYKKGETLYSEIFDKFSSIYDTGLTKILGGRGEIETVLDRTFWNSILPSLQSWESYVAKNQQTEKALLRYTLNHLLDALDSESKSCFPEEMYIRGEESHIKTGAIIKDARSFYVVLSPACDLELRDGGKPKTNLILLCEIEFIDSSWLAKDLIKLMRNSLNLYYHVLPRTETFSGGIINFRKVSAIQIEKLDSEFQKTKIRIAASFVKDIISRFSAYYARQGQPDFDFDTLVTELKERLKKDIEIKKSA